MCIRDSYKADSALWTPTIFAEIRARIGTGATELYTYTVSTAVRASLLFAGFYVARGAGTGPKQDTTVALTRAGDAQGRFALLGSDWKARWERSQSRLPPEIQARPPEQIAAFEASIRNHPQFD